MKALFFLTMDTLSAAVAALLIGFVAALISHVLNGPPWLTDAIGWSVFGGVGVRLWTSMRAMHEPLPSQADLDDWDARR